MLIELGLVTLLMLLIVVYFTAAIAAYESGFVLEFALATVSVLAIAVLGLVMFSDILV